MDGTKPNLGHRPERELRPMVGRCGTESTHVTIWHLNSGNRPWSSRTELKPAAERSQIRAGFGERYVQKSCVCCQVRASWPHRCREATRAFPHTASPSIRARWQNNSWHTATRARRQVSQRQQPRKRDHASFHDMTPLERKYFSKKK